MNAPDIDTRIVIIRAAINSVETMSRIFVLKKGVTFRISKINTRNIMKIDISMIVSLTEISVETFFRLSPKNVPTSCCQTGEMVIVSFHGLIDGFGMLGLFRFSRLRDISARTVGEISIARKISAMIPLFIL